MQAIAAAAHHDKTLEPRHIGEQGRRQRAAGHRDARIGNLFDQPRQRTRGKHGVAQPVAGDEQKLGATGKHEAKLPGPYRGVKAGAVESPRVGVSFGDPVA